LSNTRRDLADEAAGGRLENAPREPLHLTAEFRQRSDVIAAAACYEQILAADSDNWDALYLYGTALLQLARTREAIDIFRRAARLRPGIADVDNNLGVALQAIGDFDEAVRSYRSAIELNPDFDLAHANLGRLLESVGRVAEAEASLWRAVRIKPAEPSYCLQLAAVLGRQGKWREAASVLQEGSEAAPQSIALRMNLAAALVQQERLDEAADVYRVILTSRPDFAEAHSSLAFVLERQGHLPDALTAAQRAIELRLDYAEGFNNLGTVLRSVHRLDDACGAFRRAIEIDADFALAEFNLGTTLLLAGRYREGWGGYSRHARVAGTAAPGPSSTEWDGRPIPGRRLLVYADQGLGDTLQFARFLPACKEKSEGRVVFRCQPPLRRLFNGHDGVDELSTSEEAQPVFDRHIPLASLPRLFGMTIDQVGLGVPCLRPPVTVPESISELITIGRASRRIGLVWQGNPRQARDVVRSCPLEKLLPLLEIPGIRFCSLQTDAVGRSQLAASPATGRLPDVGGLLTDFADTAAVLQRLDLLITVDTAIAHLAGALGRPVWTLLCHTPDWRWHLARSDSPWYPTMRLFRQPEWGDWQSVVEQTRTALSAD
jgi:Flp pilus assembly protein TadD